MSLETLLAHNIDGITNLHTTPAGYTLSPLSQHFKNHSNSQPPTPSNHACQSWIRRKHKPIRPNHYLLNQNSCFEWVSAVRGQAWSGGVNHSVQGREWGSINIVLAPSHICVTNRSSLVYPPTPNPPGSNPSFALALSQFAWKHSQGVTGWMLGNRTDCNRADRGESDTAQCWSKNQKSKGMCVCCTK